MTAELAAWSGTADIERAADPGEFVVQACERAKQWLVEALEHGDIEQIVELKSQAEAIRIYTMQKQLGKDAELSAAEIVRRAERCIGVAIRRGQDAGEIKTQRDGGWQARLHSRDTTKKSSAEFFGSAQERSDVYGMTDGVPEEVFEHALDQAKAERNVSRANVLRHVRNGNTDLSIADRPRVIADLASQGYSSRQIGKQICVRDDRVREIAKEHGIRIRADEVVRGSRHHDSNRIVRETVHALDGLVMGIGLVDFDDLDLDEIEDWTISLANSIRALNRLNKKMKEMVQ